MRLALLAPIKRFDDAKGRLAPVLDAGQRARLARHLAGGVLAAARTAATFVACDDESVAEWAERAGAEVLWTPGLGLNGAVDHGSRTIAGKGFDVVVVAHGDLPRPEGLLSIASPGTLTLVPDRRGDGTNVMAIPLDDTELPVAQYGPGSFRRHLAAASGRLLEVRFDSALSLDIDTPPDLFHPDVHAVLPPWLRTILANRR